jgi:hypothetical protein
MLVLGSTLGSAGAVLVIVYLALAVASIVGTVKIISKAGYSGWFVLLGFVPLVNIVMFFVFAFSDWPVQKELRQFRQGGYALGPAGYPVPPWPQPPPAGYMPSTPTGYGAGGAPSSGPDLPQFPPSGWPPPRGGPAPPAPGGYVPPVPGGFVPSSPSGPVPAAPEAPPSSWPETPPPPEHG